MKKPTVTVITPLSPTRPQDMDNIREQFSKQTYKRSTLLIAGDENNIGTKRNNLVSVAKGEIIVCMDSDDIYAPDWIERSVDWLRSTGAAITGLQSAYFRQGNDRFLWEYKGTQKHVCEASMCFWRKIWGGKKIFGDTSQGEGQQFLRGEGKIIPHTYMDGFEAQLHGNNTSSHLSLHAMKKV